MRISELADRILSSNTYKGASKTGDKKNLRILLIQSLFEVYQKTQQNTVSAYGRARLGTYPEIKDAIKSVPPPQNLILEPRAFNLDVFDTMGLEDLKTDPYHIDFVEK